MLLSKLIDYISCHNESMQQWKANPADLELAEEVLLELCTGSRYCYSSIELLEFRPAGFGPVLAYICLAKVELCRQVLDFNILYVVKCNALDAGQNDVLGCTKVQNLSATHSGPSAQLSSYPAIL